MYKWVDDKGVVHYTDQVPRGRRQQGQRPAEQQGVPIKKIDPAITPEQRKATEAEQERQRDAAKQQAEAARRDRALLDSYTTESDIDLAKSRAVKTLQAALRVGTGLQRAIDQAQGGARREARRRMPASRCPADIEREIARHRRRARAPDATSSPRRTSKLVEVTAKYDADKERWQALKNGDPTRPPPAQGMATAATPAPAAAKK